MTAAADLHESAHAARVLERIRQAIAAAGGWLPFEHYMSLALYAPGLGYYSAGAHKLGRGGDFTTAPEISPLFGQCLARHCAEVLAALPEGEVLEIGAGSGRLAFDVLRAMQAAGRAPRRYRILEISADLRERQRALLSTLPPALAATVQWIDSPPAEPWQGALLANEVLDALPVECFTWRDGQVFERGVSTRAQGADSATRALGATGAADAAGEAGEAATAGAAAALVSAERAASPGLAAEVTRLRRDADADWPDGYTSELCTRAGPWIAAMTHTLQRGVALFIDYGLPRREYYSADRNRGTLRCHYRQRAHDDPFAHPGLEDITAWVDFTRVAEAADSAGLEVLGYATQAGMLLGLGIEAALSASTDERTRIMRAAEARQLLMPNEMGETFKCIALGRDWNAPLAAFAHQDLRDRL